MCLVIMYGIKKDVDVNLMEKMFYMQFDVKPMLNEFELIGNNLNEYNFFNIGACNCGSYITMLKDKKINNFEDYYNLKKQEFTKRVNDVVLIKQSPKYEKLKAKFVKEFDKKRKEMQKYAVSDTKHMQDYENWLKKNQVFTDDLLGGLENDKCDYIINTSLNDLIEKEVKENFDKDTSIIDGVLTMSDEILIIPIWQEGGKFSYKVKVTDIDYSNLDYNTLGNLNYAEGLRILDK